ncbi:MAG: ATP cone domain-containing protein [Deinococcales bacterium]
MREIHVSSGNHDFPFSKGLVVESLLNADIARDPAMAIARRVEQRLVDKKLKMIDPFTLKQIILEETKDMLGESAAQKLERQTTAFEDVIVHDKERSIPFSKGLLSRSLELAGIPIKDAFGFAKDLEKQLRVQGISEISRTSLEDITLEQLERVYGTERKEAYLERYQRATQVMVLEDDDGVTFPFSKGILAQSLMATGLNPALAHQIAKEVEIDLLKQNELVVSRDRLRSIVESVLKTEISEEVARRYTLLRSIRRPEKPILILIGGVTGTGKSVLAAEVGYRLGITRVESSDSIRQVMRAMISKELLPALHASTFDAWTATLEPIEEAQFKRGGGRQNIKPSREQLLDGFRDQVKQVSVGVRAIVERASKEHTSMIIEGVHIVPGYLPVDLFENAIVVPMVVAVHSVDTHRQRFYSRDAETNKHRPMQRYLEHFDDIRNLQEYVERLARAVGVPIIDGESLDAAVEGAIEVVAQRVLSLQKREAF